MTEFFNDLILQLTELKVIYIYGAILLISYLENVVPPIPGDLVIVFAGYLIGLGIIEFPQALIFSTVGSFLGFIHIYGLGRWLGDSIMSEKRLTFLPKEKIKQVGAYFSQYGYSLIFANRFLAGTRAVISLFSGIAKLAIWKTSIAAIVSAVAWNALLLWLGNLLGENWRNVMDYLQSYSIVVSSIIAILVIFFGIRYYKRRKK